MQRRPHKQNGDFETEQLIIGSLDFLLPRVLAHAYFDLPYTVKIETGRRLAALVEREAA